MTNLNKIKTLTVKELAQLNIKSHIYNVGYQVMCDFITTDGNVFGSKPEAVQYELEWLQSEVNEEDGIFNFNY